MSALRLVPPSPEVIRALYEQYLREGQPAGLSFEQYLKVIGFTNRAADTHGMDDGVMVRAVARDGGPELITVPNQRVQGQLRVMVLLVDFEDREGTTARAHYENLLFSKDTHPTGSMRDYYEEVSLGKVDVIGEVHGWLRLPKQYTYYAGGQSGTGDNYPRNAQKMAEDAVHAALDQGVRFSQELDVLGQDTVTALFIVHAGIGAETQFDGPSQNNNIWSHKWGLRIPVEVATDLWVTRYLTVPHDAKLGVCAHELGHLAFQWEDYYDPNYAEDGSAWDGAGDWDLMAGGSYNGDSNSPAHPIAWHKSQHDWIELEEVRSSQRLVLEPFTATSGKAYKLVSSKYLSSQYLVVENRTRFGFDAHLPGEGLLVWRVDESKEMLAPDTPALQLMQADGRHDLERVDDLNAGDSGDPFPGSTGRVSVSDSGNVSTSFPGGDLSMIELKDIQRDPQTGRITLDAEFDGVAVTVDPPPPPPPTETTVVQGESSPGSAIPDNDAGGVEDVIALTEGGTVRGITVAIDISHTYMGDLRVELIAPSGQKAILHNQAGGPANDLLKTYSLADSAALEALADASVSGEWRLRVSDHARRDVGTLNRWSLRIEAAPGSRDVHEKSRPGVTIPDKDPSGIADVIRIAQGGIARSIAVGVDITHTYVGDLRVELVGPSGQRAVLRNLSGGDADNLKETWHSADTSALAVFVGTAARGDWVLRVSDHYGQDEGTLSEWTLDIELGGEARTVEKSVTPGLAVPDDDAAGVSSHIVVTETGTAQSIELELAITHTYVGDLRVELHAPSGERTVLHDRSGGNGNDLHLQLDSSSSTALAELVGQPLKGNWVLRVMDLEAHDEGTLDHWSLKLTYTD